MKKAAWIIYSLLIAAVAAFEFISTPENQVFLSYVRLLFTTLYLIGLYGYVFQKAIGQPSQWRFLFWLNIVLTAFSLTVSLFINFSVAILDGLITIIFVAPLLYALYKYSSKNFPVWSKSHFGEYVNLLTQLFIRSPKASASSISSESGEQTTATIEATDSNEYEIRVITNQNGESKSFKNTFQDLHSLAVFIEKQTVFRPGDFANNA